MSEARNEAERIVGDYARIVRSVEREPRLDGMIREHGEAVVAALAAAIEETDAEQEAGAFPTSRLLHARAARRDALSALRGRAGEET